jgi:hypothetical protein
VTFGPESTVIASDADARLIEATKSITSRLGRSTRDFGLNEKILLSSVLVATTSFILRPTLAASFCDVVLDLEGDYTLVPFRKKSAADGPRYKALGNSMAVPVMRWIGERIAKDES